MQGTSRSTRVFACVKLFWWGDPQVSLSRFWSTESTGPTRPLPNLGTDPIIPHLWATHLEL